MARRQHTGGRARPGRGLAAALLVTPPLLLAGCGDDGGSALTFELQRLGPDGTPYAAGSPRADDPWPCVRDQRTGLVWEVKTKGPGLRAAANTYTWRAAADQPGEAGSGTADGGACRGSACDTAAYVAAVNRRELCGYSDWRVPRRSELGSLNDPRIAFPGPTLPTAYFPNTRSAGYWSATPYRFRDDGAWLWGFDYGLDRVDWKSAAHHLRLVRGEPRPDKRDR